MTDTAADDLLILTAEIVAAQVASNAVAASDLPSLIQAVHAALAGLGRVAAPTDAKPVPAVSIRSSVRPDHVVCLEDGQKMTMLKRHLRTEHGLTPAAYRAKWKLPADHPLVAPNYAEKRRALAKASGLGVKKPARSKARASKPRATLKPRFVP